MYFRKFIKISLFCSIFVCFQFLHLFAGEVTFSPSYPIVVADKASAAEKFAAQEIASFAGKAVGVSPSVIAESEYKGSQAIFVGPTEFAVRNGMKDYQPEEYHIKAIDNNIVVAGGRPRGVLFGAYEFIEKVLGVRFLSINYTYIPNVKKIEFASNLNLRHNPPFRFRMIWAGEPVAMNGVFLRRMRQNGNSPVPEQGFYEVPGSPGRWHNMRFYTEDLPLEISWMNGDKVREKPASNGLRGSLCFSHPEVLKRISAKLRKHIENDRKKADENGYPYPYYYAVDGNDCPVECFCDDCQKLVKKYGVSGMVMDFMNRLWGTIKGDYPDVRLIMFAYMDALHAPKGGIKPAEGVMVRIAYYDGTGVKRDPMRPLNNGRNVEYVKILEGWKKNGAELAIWDYWKFYNRSGDSTPVNNALDIAELIRKYKDVGVKNVFVEWEMYPESPMAFYDLRYYLGSKLLNDPDADDKALYNEFMDLYYGKAAPLMKEYINYSRTRLLAGKETPGPFVLESCKFMDADYFRTLYGLIDKAAVAVKEDKLALDNVIQERLILDIAYVKLWNKLNNPMKFGEEDITKRIIAAADAMGKKYYPSHWHGKNRQDAIKGFSTIIKFPKRSEVGFRPLKEIPRLGTDFIRIEGDDLRGGGKVSDPDARNGVTRSLDSMGIKNFHNQPFSFGIYEFNYGKHLVVGWFKKELIPQDEKFYWYFAGRTRVFSEKTNLWMHRSWRFQFSLGKGLTDGISPLYDVYVSMKLQGPAYVKGSTQKNAIKVDQIILVKRGK